MKRLAAAALAASILAFPIATRTQQAPSADKPTAIMLLERVETLLNKAAGEPNAAKEIVGTSGSHDSSPAKGTVTMERADVDEIRAEIAQIKALVAAQQLR